MHETTATERSLLRLTRAGGAYRIEAVPAGEGPAELDQCHLAPEVGPDGFVRPGAGVDPRGPRRAPDVPTDPGDEAEGELDAPIDEHESRHLWRGLPHIPGARQALGRALRVDPDRVKTRGDAYNLYEQIIEATLAEELRAERESFEGRWAERQRDHTARRVAAARARAEAMRVAPAGRAHSDGVEQLAEDRGR